MPFDDKKNNGMTAKRIKYARTCAKMTQADVAAVLNLTPQQVSNYERGLTRVPDSVIPKMAKLFGVSTDFILGMSGSVPLPKDIQIILGDAADKLTPGEVQAAIELDSIFHSFIRYVGTEYKNSLPGAASCMEAAALCFANICELSSGKKDCICTDSFFAHKILDEIQQLSNRYAYFALEQQCKDQTIPVPNSDTPPPEHEE